MDNDFKKIKAALKAADEKFTKDGEIPSKAEEYRKKYSILTERDLLKSFTI